MGEAEGEGSAREHAWGVELALSILGGDGGGAAPSAVGVWSGFGVPRKGRGTGEGQREKPTFAIACDIRRRSSDEGSAYLSVSAALLQVGAPRAHSCGSPSEVNPGAPGLVPGVAGAPSAPRWPGVAAPPAV